MLWTRLPLSLSGMDILDSVVEKFTSYQERTVVVYANSLI